MEEKAGGDGMEKEGCRRSGQGFWQLFHTSLRRKVVCCSFGIFFLVLGICVFLILGMYYYTQQRERDEYLRQSSARAEAWLQRYFATLNDQANTVRFSRWVQQMLRDNPLQTASQRQTVVDNATNFLNSMSDVTGGNRYYLMDREGNCLNLSGTDLQFDTNVEGRSWYGLFLEEGRYLEEALIGFAHSLEKERYISLYYPITDISNFDLLGYLLICVPVDNLRFGVEDVAEGHYTAVLGSSGEEIVSGVPRDDPEMPGVGEMAAFAPGIGMHQGHRLFCADVEELNWRVCVVADKAVDFSYLPGNFFSIFLVFLPIGLLIVLLAAVFARYLTKPILQCKDALLAVRNSSFGVQIPHSYRDEIGDLLDGFNRMSAELETLMRQNRLIESLRRDAEFETLQQKINPHFLYNTLDIINGLILTDRKIRAVQVCETLGRLFQYNLLDKRHVPLREEYAYIRQYLLIHEYKNERLRVDWDIDERALDLQVPKMTLQPFVENAVKHGFQDRVGECCLTVSLREAAGAVEITIMDNGRGICPDKLERIKQELGEIHCNREDEGRCSIGLSNPYHRLLLAYGTRFRFDIVSREGFGTQIRIGLVRMEAPV